MNRLEAEQRMKIQREDGLPDEVMREDRFTRGRRTCPG
jgi:hypothetical protein